MLLTLMFDYLSGQTIFVFTQLIVVDWILLIKRQALTCLLQQTSFSFSAVYVFPAVPLRRVNNHLFRRRVSFGQRPDQDCWQVRSAGDRGGSERKVGDGRGNRENDIPINPWHAVARAVGWVSPPRWRRFFKDAGRSGKIRNWPCSTIHQSVEPSMDGGMKVTSQSTAGRRNWHDGAVSIFQLQDVLESIATMQKAFLRELTRGRSEKDQELLVGKLTVLNISSADRRGDQDTVLLRTRDDAVWRSIITMTEMHARWVAAWRQVNSDMHHGRKKGGGYPPFHMLCTRRNIVSKSWILTR